MGLSATAIVIHTDGEGTHEIIAQHKIPVVVSFNTLWLLYRSSQEKKHPRYLRIHNICAFASNYKLEKTESALNFDAKLKILRLSRKN